MTTHIDVVDVRVETLHEYGRIPMAFSVESVYDIREIEKGRFEFQEQRAAIPHLHDYPETQSPAAWEREFDLSHWKFFIARVGSRAVGGATIVVDSPGVDMLEGRSDLGILWDIRVHPNHRGHGVGTALFRAVALYARERGCIELKVETQQINVAACKFYASQGCELRAIRHNAYPEFPDEIQLLWYKNLLQ